MPEPSFHDRQKRHRARMPVHQTNNHRQVNVEAMRVARAGQSRTERKARCQEHTEAMKAARAGVIVQIV